MQAYHSAVHLKEEKGKLMASSTTADVPRNSVTVPYREEEAKNAISEDSVRFLQYLINNQQEREKLQDATTADIVQAGKNAGYHFIESDLDTLIQRFTVDGTKPEAKLRGCHNSNGDGTWD